MVGNWCCDLGHSSKVQFWCNWLLDVKCSAKGMHTRDPAWPMLGPWGVCQCHRAGRCSKNTFASWTCSPAGWIFVVTSQNDIRRAASIARNRPTSTALCINEGQQPSKRIHLLALALLHVCAPWFDVFHIRIKLKNSSFEDGEGKAAWLLAFEQEHQEMLWLKHISPLPVPPVPHNQVCLRSDIVGWSDPQTERMLHCDHVLIVG